MSNTTTKQTIKDGRVRNLKAENRKLLDEVSKLRNEIKSFKESNKISTNMLHNQSDTIRELKSNIYDLKDELKCITSDSNATKKAFDKMEEHYNKHMDIAENEIKRLNQIIFYLETKCLKGFE